MGKKPTDRQVMDAITAKVKGIATGRITGREQPPARKAVRIDVALAKAIKASGRTHYAIGVAAGVSSTTIDRFMYRDERHRGLTLETAARIATALGLELRPVT